MKKILGLSTLALAGVLAFTGCSCKDKGEELSQLPAARLGNAEGCYSNDYDKTCSSINSKNLNEYLGRSDVDYIDVRNFSDYEFEHLEGFRNVQFFADIWNKDGVAGGKQLFNKDYTPKYKDSVKILESYFPKDKTLFLMCASGGRVVWLMDILELNGWDMTKIYNVGGMGDYTDAKYDSYRVSKSNAALTFKTATITEGNYTATAHIALDKDNKITNIYVTGSEMTPGVSDKWNQDTWLKAKYEYCQKLVGKTKADIQEMVNGDEGAKGEDVVTGATTTSNRVLEAVLAAFDAQ